MMERTVKTRIDSLFKRTLDSLRLAQIVIALSVLLFNSVCLAADLTNESLAGTWNFTHMVLDGDVDNPRPANVIMEFFADGQIVNKYGQGKVTPAEYRIDVDSIIYSDKNGEQRWQVVEYSEGKLHVNNSGAEMFFERQ